MKDKTPLHELEQPAGYYGKRYQVQQLGVDEARPELRISLRGHDYDTLEEALAAARTLIERTGVPAWKFRVIDVPGYCNSIYDIDGAYPNITKGEHP